MGKKSYKTIQILTLSEGFESKHFKRLFRFELSVQNDKMSAEGSKEKKSLPSETPQHNGHSVGNCDSCDRGTDHTNSVKSLYSFLLRCKNNFETHN